MKTRPWSWSIAALLLALALLMSVRVARLTRRAEADLAEAERQRNAVRDRAEAAGRAAEGKTVPDMNAPGPSQEKSNQKTDTASAAPQVVPGGPLAIRVPDGMTSDTPLAIDPEARALHLRAFDEEFDGKWGMLARRLEFTAEKLAAFKALLRTEAERRLDVLAVAWEQKLRPSDPALKKMRENDQAWLGGEMDALLGPEGIAAYQQYRRDIDLQGTLADVAGRTYLSASPLTSAEADRLLAILSNRTPRKPNGDAQPYTMDWEAVEADTEASGTFSPVVKTAISQLAATYRMQNKAISARTDDIMGRMQKELANGPESKSAGGSNVIWLPAWPALQPWETRKGK